MRQSEGHLYARDYRGHVLLSGICLSFFILFVLLGTTRHGSYMTITNDLGVFDQVIWMASRGEGLVNTSNFGTPVNWLGFHFQPVLYVFALLYKITPSVNWLIAAQSASLALAAWPVYALAFDASGSVRAGLAWSLVYLCNPFTLNAAAWDFHPVTLAVPLLALGMLAVERKQFPVLLIACVIMLSIKEHMGLAIAGLGLLYAIYNREWIAGLSLFLAGTAVFLLVIFFIMPAIGSDQHPMFSDQTAGLGRYSWLGASPTDSVNRILSNPGDVLKTVFTDHDGGRYLVLLGGPLLFLPVLSLPWLLPATSDVLINLLSSVPLPRSVYSYHSVLVIPAFIAAAIHGSVVIARLAPRMSSTMIAVLVLATTVTAGYRHAPLPIPGARNIWGLESYRPETEPAPKQLYSIIGQSPLSVQNNAGPHFTHREHLYRFPDMIDSVDFVLLRLDNPSNTYSLLPHFLGMPTDEYLDTVTALLQMDGFATAYSKPPWLLMQRTGQSKASNNQEILDQVGSLRDTWKAPAR